MIFLRDNRESYRVHEIEFIDSEGWDDKEAEFIFRNTLKGDEVLLGKMDKQEFWREPSGLIPLEDAVIFDHTWLQGSCALSAELVKKLFAVHLTNLENDRYMGLESLHSRPDHAPDYVNHWKNFVSEINSQLAYLDNLYSNWLKQQSDPDAYTA